MFVAAMLDALPELREPRAGRRSRRCCPPGRAAAGVRASVERRPARAAFGLASAPRATRNRPPRTRRHASARRSRQRLRRRSATQLARRRSTPPRAGTRWRSSRSSPRPRRASTASRVDDGAFPRDRRLGFAAWTWSPPAASPRRSTARAGASPPCRAAAARCAPRTACCRCRRRRRRALLDGFPWRDDGIGGERVTPTGAAILRHLVRPRRCDAGQSSGRLLRAAAPAPARARCPACPTCCARWSSSDATAIAGRATSRVIEFDIDDMTGEEIGVAADRLRAVDGVARRVGRHAHRQEGAHRRRLPRCSRRPTPPTPLPTRASPRPRPSACASREERRRVLPRSEVASTSDGTRLRVKVARAARRQRHGEGRERRRRRACPDSPRDVASRAAKRRRSTTSEANERAGTLDRATRARWSRRSTATPRSRSPSAAASTA